MHQPRYLGYPSHGATDAHRGWERSGGESLRVFVRGDDREPRYAAGAAPERHWIITSAGKHFAEVVGPGVVGQQPTIGAGESFEYSSSAVIEDPIGTMQGSYTFRAQDGKFLTVESRSSIWRIR